MEKGSYRFTKEERNFWILDVLIKYVAQPAVKKRFDVIIPPADLATVLNSNVRVIQNLISRKVINVYQQEVLQRVPGFNFPTIMIVPTPKTTATSSADFDITLMICLLRSLKFVQEPTTGWDRLPSDRDKSLGAHLTRIKVYRNKLSHPSKSRINENSFNKIWSSLKEALSEISEGEADAIVSEIETFDLEGSNKEELLCRIQQEVQEMRNELQFHLNLKENTINLVEKWRADAKDFYKTRGTEEVLKKIRSHSTIMIVGNSGSGKSATMKYVSLLLEKEGFEIIPVSYASDILFQRFSTRKQLFIIDDICGKYRVDDVILESWQRINNRLELIFKDKSAKLLCTLRRQLQNDINELSISTVFNSTVVDLDSNDLVLSLIEKEEMFRNYMIHRHKQDDIDTEELERICRCHYAFPLLCDLFFSNPEFFKRKAKFFSNPTIIFREELDRLQKKNKEVYCVLVFNVIFKTKTLQSFYDITCEYQRKNDFLLSLQACEVPESVPRKRLYKHLLSVSGSFVQSDNLFSFIHDRLEETIACHFGSRFPDIMFQCCKREFIRERVVLQECHEVDQEVLILKPSSYDAFAKRIQTEILNGKFRDVLLSEPLRSRDYVNYFLSYLQKSNLSLKDFEQLPCTDSLALSLQQVGGKFRNITNTNTHVMLEVLQDKNSIFTHWLVATGCYYLFNHIYKGPKSTLRYFFKRYTPVHVTDLLHLAVLGENIDIVRLLISKGGNVKSCDQYGIPLMCKIAKTNNCAMANVLIEEGANVDQTDEVLGWTACFVASWFNKIEMLILLLSRGSDANYCDFLLRTPLAIAVLRNNEQAVSVLLRYGAIIYDEFLYFDLPINSHVILQEALLNKNSKIVKTLLVSGRARNDLSIVFPLAGLFKNKCIINDQLGLFLKDLKTVSSGNSLLRDFVEICNAIYENDIQKIHKIFKIKRQSLHSLIFQGRYRTVTRKCLLANFNGNNLRMTLLHIAASCDAVNAAKMLMKFGANPFLRDIKDRTPLHLARSKDMVETLLSSNIEQFHEEKLKVFPSLKKCLLFFVTFKFIPAATRMLVSCRSGVNTIDRKGNTPLHSMIIRMTNVTSCLDAVESLLRHGADPRIRCNNGYLPIDHFRTVSLSIEENEVERGEKLLACPKTRSFIKKEAWYLTAWGFLFISFIVWFYLSIIGNTCVGMGSPLSWKPNSIASDSELLHFRCLVYAHFLSVLLLNRLTLVFCSLAKLFVFEGKENISTRSSLYAENSLLYFSEKITMAMVIIGTVSYYILNQNGQTIFNLYCVFLCLCIYLIYFPYPLRKSVCKYKLKMLKAMKVIMLFFVITGVSNLAMHNPNSTILCSDNAVEVYISFFYFLKILVMKVACYFVYVFIFRNTLISPLIFILFQPIHWYRHDYMFIMSRCLVLFLMIDVVTVPVIQYFCDISLCLVIPYRPV